MPPRIKQICRAKGCHALTDAPGGYCSEHTGQAVGWRRVAAKSSSSERGYGASWRKRRERIMQRDRGLCQPCIRKGIITSAYAVDHIVPKAAGGTDDDTNLEAICRCCHKQKTQQEASAGRHGQS